jgi:hypothetical protein
MLRAMYKKMEIPLLPHTNLAHDAPRRPSSRPSTPPSVRGVPVERIGG